MGNGMAYSPGSGPSLGAVLRLAPPSTPPLSQYNEDEDPDLFDVEDEDDSAPTEEGGAGGAAGAARRRRRRASSVESTGSRAWVDSARSLRDSHPEPEDDEGMDPELERRRVSADVSVGTDNDPEETLEASRRVRPGPAGFLGEREELLLWARGDRARPWAACD